MRGLHVLSWSNVAVLLGSIVCWNAPAQVLTSGSDSFANLEVTKLIVMPQSAGHSDWVDAIAGAKSSVHMTMYHITDTKIINALIAKAKDTSVDLRVIVDGGSLTGGYLKAFQSMTSAGVNVVGSSKAFSLTHSKDMVIDGKTAFVSAINMTNTTTNTRDFGIITPDSGVISEIESVFTADWANAQNGGKDTPALSNPNLVWSPTTSSSLLVQLIDSATSTLVAETESFDAQEIITHLNQAAARGVKVRLIVPECDLGSALFDYPYLAQLSGVNVHVEHDGDSISQPYMHSKMMIVDGTTMYIGSINYTLNSIQNDRELGVIFTNSTISDSLSGDFEMDWSRSQTPATSPSCPSSN
jgi:cardiolipin synthase